MKTVEFKIDAREDCIEFLDDAMDYGYDDFDHRHKAAILAELADGNVWAWADVEVSAYVDTGECAECICGCNYKDEADFKDDVWYIDMKVEALRQLRIECEGTMRAIESAERDLAAERKAWDKRQGK